MNVEKLKSKWEKELTIAEEHMKFPRTHADIWMGVAARIREFLSDLDELDVENKYAGR